MTKTKQELHNSRPTSPHLGIYKIQISSSLSIFHRLSGAALFISLSFFTWWFILWVFSKFDLCYIEFTHNWIFKLFALGTSLAAFYHLCNGIRHLFWDMGKGFSIKCMNATGITVLIASLIMTAAFWVYICNWI